MIVLDTNVLSALMRSVPDQQVIAWLDGQPAESIWTTSVTVFEVRYGLHLLAKGRKRRVLEQAFEAMLETTLARRVLDFDLAAAGHAAQIAAHLRRLGRPVEVRDTQIAGIVAARSATLATRNLRHFTDTNVPLINPWAD